MTDDKRTLSCASDLMDIWRWHGTDNVPFNRALNELARCFPELLRPKKELMLERAGIDPVTDDDDNSRIATGGNDPKVEEPEAVAGWDEPAGTDL